MNKIYATSVQVEQFYNEHSRIHVELIASPNINPRSLMDSEWSLDYMFYDKVVIKCSYCGQWGARKCACKYCGAPID